MLEKKDYKDVKEWQQFTPSSKRMAVRANIFHDAVNRAQLTIPYHKSLLYMRLFF